MIIRKPYAFLIKYFKVIHILMFVVFGYYIVALTDIKNYFTNAVTTNNYVSIGNESYFSVLYIILAILLLGVSIAILFLMRQKKKPFIFYIGTGVYAFLLIVMAILFNGYFNEIAKTGTAVASTVVIYRDFAVVMYYLAFVFVIFCFIRGFGFDIKKFSFDKDKEELNLSQDDNAEVVLDLNIDKDKIMNKARKYKREWGYIYEDNKVLLKRLGIGIVAIIAIYLIATSNIFSKTYQMGAFIDAGRFGIKIDKVILTNKDAYQEERDRNYAAVLFTIKTGGDGTYFDNSFLRLKVNGEYYYAATKINSVMDDVGKLYTFEKLAGGSEFNFVLLFDYDKNINPNSVGLEVFLDGSYHDINVKYIIQDKKGYKEKEAKLGESIDVLGGLSINSFTIHGGTTEYRYTEKNCKENCREFTKRVQPNLNEKLLELNVKYESNETNNKLLNYYISIEYEMDDGTHVNTAKEMNLLNIANLSDGQRLYYSINSDISTAKKKYLVITTREVKYRILLQEENG